MFPVNIHISVFILIGFHCVAVLTRECQVGH